MISDGHLISTSVMSGPSLVITREPGRAPRESINTGMVVSAPISVWFSDSSAPITGDSAGITSMGKRM